MDIISTWEVDETVFVTGILDTPMERALAAKLRWKMYVEQNGEIPPDHVLEPYRSAREEIDEYDDHSIHLLCFKREGDRATVAGTLRLVRAEGGLPLETAVFNGEPFRLPDRHPVTGEDIRRESVAEASRWIIDGPQFTASGKRVYPGTLLYEAGLEVLRRERRRWWLNALNARKFVEMSKVWPFVELIPNGPHPYPLSVKKVPVNICIAPVPRNESGDYRMPRIAV